MIRCYYCRAPWPVLSPCCPRCGLPPPEIVLADVRSGQAVL